MAIDTSQFRNGLKIELDGNPFVITYFQHVKPGKGGAFVRTKVKNLLNGKVLERTFRSGEKCEEPDVQERKLQYLYHDGTDLVFMDTETFDQMPIPNHKINRGATATTGVAYMPDTQGLSVKATLSNEAIKRPRMTPVTQAMTKPIRISRASSISPKSSAFLMLALSPASNGTRAMRGITARSWNSSTPNAARPWGVVSSFLSASICSTNAVLESERPKPTRIAGAQSKENQRATPVRTAPVRRT